MKYSRWISICLALLFFSCQSNRADFQNGVSGKDNQPVTEEGKPVIALMPVRFDAEEPVAQTLGEAYSTTISDLLESMQTYDVRPIPGNFTEEDLVNRGYDNIISAEVTLQDKGTLNLNASVRDARTGEDLVHISESTGNYLALFSTAELMVNRMVEEFYGGHLEFSQLKILGEVPKAVIIDGVFRTPDAEGIVPLLAGEHHITLMGAENHILNYSSDRNFKEEETVVMNTFSQSALLLYMGTDTGIRVDGDPSDWDVPYLEQKHGDSPIFPQGPQLAMDWFRITADEERIYGIIKMPQGFPSQPARVSISFFSLEDSQSSGIEIQRTGDGRIEVYERARGSDVESNSGRAAASGEYLEFSCSIDVLRLYRDSLMKMKIRNNLGPSYDERVAQDEIPMEEIVKLTSDPTPMLLWRNRDWVSGTDTERSSYRVPQNLIAIDRDPLDWSIPPILAQDSGSEQKGDLLLLKSAVGFRFLYLFLQSDDKWQEDRHLRFELDGGDGISRELTIQGRDILLEQNGEIKEIEGEVQYGENFLEAALPMSELGKNLDYALVMRVIQEGGNTLRVLPYY